MRTRGFVGLSKRSDFLWAELLLTLRSLPLSAGSFNVRNSYWFSQMVQSSFCLFLRQMCEQEEGFEVKNNKTEKRRDKNEFIIFHPSYTYGFRYFFLIFSELSCFFLYWCLLSVDYIKANSLWVWYKCSRATAKSSTPVLCSLHRCAHLFVRVNFHLAVFRSFSSICTRWGLWPSVAVAWCDVGQDSLLWRGCTVLEVLPRVHAGLECEQVCQPQGCTLHFAARRYLRTLVSSLYFSVERAQWHGWLMLS